MVRTPALFAAMAVAALSAPAMAEADADDALRALDDPERVEAMASAIEGITAAMMAMPVGPLVDAVRRADPDAWDEGDDLPSDATLGDLARSDPDMPARLGDEARVAGEVAGEAARDLAVALPMLSAIASDLAAQWQQRMADARRRHRR